MQTLTLSKLTRVAWICAAASCFLYLTACAGTATWLSDAMQIVPLATSMIASILTLAASLQGKSVPTSDLNLVSQFAADIENGLKDLETMIDQYKATPTSGLQQEILNAAQTVTANIQKFLTDTQLSSAALAEKVTAIAQLVQSQLQAWIEVIPALQASAGTKVSFTVPYTSKAFRQAFDLALDTPSGNADVDAVAAKLKRL